MARTYHLGNFPFLLSHHSTQTLSLSTAPANIYTRHLQTGAIHNTAKTLKKLCEGMADAATPGPAARRGSGAPSQGSRWGAPTWLRFLFVAPPVARAVALLAARRLWWGWDVRRDDTAGSGPDHSITGGCWLKLSTRRHVGGAGAKSGISARLAIERNPHALSIVE